MSTASPDPGTSDRSRVSRLAQIAFLSALAVAAIAILAGPAYRLGVPLKLAFLGLAVGAVGGVITGVLSAVAAVMARPGRGVRGRNRALAGLLISVLVSGFVWSLYSTARTVPPIHDITTDTENPPEFESVLKLRTEDMNSAVYAGEEIARQQLVAYPDITPRVVTIAPGEALELAETTARALGWDIVNVDSTRLRLEATDTTLWFGFSDDVVIRIRPDARGSVIDIRSASRVGVSDVGANADRIRRFFAVYDDLD